MQVVTNGCTSPLTASSFTVNITGTTLAADITNLKLWTTGTSSTFAATMQLGATVVTPTGSHIITGGTNMPYTLSSGINYFWLTYDIPSGATLNNIIDAQCTSITIGGTPRTPTTQIPAGNRQIVNQVVIGTGTSTNYWPFYTSYGYSRSASLFTAAEVGTPCLITLLDYNISAATTSNIPVKIYLKTTSASSLSSDNWNNMIAGATLVYDATTQFTPTGWKTFNISDFNYCADNLIVLCEANYGASGAGSTPYFYYTTASTASHEVWYDDTSPPTVDGTTGTSRPNITITKSTAVGMSFTSCTTTQNNTADVLINTGNQEVIGMQVVTNGCTSALTASSFTINITGTTIAADITNLKLWTTGTSSTFAAATQLGATVVTPTGTHIITGGTNMPYTLTSGINYFWLTYDIPVNATVNNVIDAQCTSITIGGTPRTPTVQNPAGTRQIKAYIILGTGTSTTSFPYRSSYEDARSQFIITAAELTNAGLCSGAALSSLSFNVSSKSSTAQFTNFTLKIGHIGASASFASAAWFSPTFTTVFNANYTTVDASWNLHTFTSNFTWNGSDNIVIESCYNNTEFTSDDYVYYTSTASSVCTAEMDGDAGCTLAAEYTSSYRPNMKFDYIPSQCSGTPVGGTTSATPASICSGQSYTLNLTGQTLTCGISYQWQTSTNPITTWSNIAGATALNYTVTPVGSVNYRCVVTCSNSGLSANSSSILVNIPGHTCSNPVNVTLPYTKTGETTECMNNDYTNSSTASCSSQYESGEDKVYKVLVYAAGCVNITLTNASSTSIGFQIYDGCPDAVGTSCIFNTTTGATGGTLSSDVNFPSAGYYYVIIDNWASGTNYVDYDIAISAPGGNTTNDAVCNAVSLTLGISTYGDNTCTNSSGEPAAPACWSSGTMSTVWYRVTVPASQDLAIKTIAGSLLNTQIDVYQGNSCGSLTYVNCNDDASDCGSSSYGNSYLLVQNITSTYIYIRVDGNLNTVGSFSILAIDGNNGSPVWPVEVGQDCGPVSTNTNPVCGQTTYIDNPGYLAYGSNCDFTGSGICLASGERSSVWYTLVINGNGNLEFDIVPNDYGNPNPLTGQMNSSYTTANSETDYDWALWKWESACDGSGDGVYCCSELDNSTTSCNYDQLGVTGLYSTGNAPAIYSSSFNAAYEPAIAVTNGDIYILAISNYADDYVSGFTMQFSASSPIAYATPGSVISWGSNTNISWTQASNWGGCSPPTCTLDATISSGGAQPIISTNASVHDLTINPGASLVINPGKTLTVCGDFTNDGTITMSPTSTLLFDNGSIVQYINGSLTGANKIGNIIINKTGGSVILNAAADIGNITTQNTTSIFNVNNQTLKVAGDINMAANTTLTNCPNIEFNGTYPQTFSNSSGSVTFTNILMNNSGGGITLSGTATSSIYVSGVLTLTNGIIYTSALPLLIMNAGSSVSGGSASSFVDGPMQKIGNTAFVFPLGDAFNRWARIGISNLGDSETFQAQYFYSAYSNTTSMSASPTPVIYNVSLLEYWQLDLVSTPGSADVTLYWENASSSGINSCANNGDLVVARFNGTSWENKNATSSVVTGSCAGTSAGTITSNTFTGFSPISFGSKTGINPLPAELISFAGKNKNNINILNWTTASEINNDFFTLERSTDAVDFTEIGTIKGSGNSNSVIAYQFIDSKPNEGINYYRLKQTDFDGKYKFASNVVVLEYKLPVEYVIFPNPAREEIMVYSTSKKEENIQYLITDISGRKILQKNSFTLKNDNQAASIDIMSISEGIYFLTISDINNKTITQKRFVKIK